ncbi:hypothetical protein EZJ19_12785, partial [Parasulfuritortus cantonensis]
MQTLVPSLSAASRSPAPRAPRRSSASTTPAAIATRLSARLLVLACLAGATPARAADGVPPSCIGAYDQLRAGKLSEAAAGMAECGAASRPGPARTVLLYDRVRVLDRLGRADEARAQLLALTDKADFETGLADEVSGPGAWSRDPELVRARRATGVNRADLLLDLAWRALRAKDAKGAVDWAERSARHALTRFRPEAEWLPMDRDAGCAIALRGFARADLGDDQGALVDIVRGYIRGCDKLPVAEKAGLLGEDSRRRVDELKRRFDALQDEVRRVTEANR